MVWKRLFRREEPEPEPEPVVEAATAKPRRTDLVDVSDPATKERAEALRRRREMVLFDLERAEAARQPDNPWQERIDLLDESLATVEADEAALEREAAVPGFPVPETPITAIVASGGEPAEVRFRIGPEAFLFQEETDWDQRGGPVVRGELKQRAGEAGRLVPDDAPVAERDPLAAHLRESVVVFATDLRDREIEGEALPVGPTLADLARPCPECGGWRDWRGTCARCAERAFRRQHLRTEAERLRRERDEEAEERRKWAERVPIARRRLADVDAEIARLGGA